MDDIERSRPALVCSPPWSNVDRLPDGFILRGILSASGLGNVIQLQDTCGATTPSRRPGCSLSNPSSAGKHEGTGPMAVEAKA